MTIINSAKFDGVVKSQKGKKGPNKISEISDAVILVKLPNGLIISKNMLPILIYNVFDKRALVNVQLRKYNYL